MVFRVLLLVYRKPGLTPSEFKLYYEGTHVPLMKQLGGSLFPLTHSRRYILRPNNSAADSTSEVAPPEDYPATIMSGTRCDFLYDAITEMVFEDQAAFIAFSAVLGSPEVKPQVAADCANFMDMEKVTPMVVLEECVETRK